MWKGVRNECVNVDSSCFFMTGNVWIKVKHKLYGMDMGKSCSNMNDMVLTGVWHGRRVVDMVAKVTSQSK